MFARLANGNVAPKRVIEGQGTNLSRTMHGIAYDQVHDEIVIPVALGGALLVFRGDAAGEAPPLRTIQGTRTRLVRPHTVAVDPVNNEILTADPSMRAIVVFDRAANGTLSNSENITPFGTRGSQCPTPADVSWITSSNGIAAIASGLNT